MLGMLQWGIRQSSETENHLTSIERLLEYAKLEPEPSLATDEKQAKVKFTRKNAKDKLNSILSDNDPNDVKTSGKTPAKSTALEKIERGSSKEGEVSFEKFSFNYYTDGPIVLKSMSLTIRPGEKVGIGKLETDFFSTFLSESDRCFQRIKVGRTGAGKSSLISALFRINNGIDGDIFVNGSSTGSTHLKQLRQKISIIPQEPVIFSDNVRANLGMSSLEFKPEKFG